MITLRQSRALEELVGVADLTGTEGGGEGERSSAACESK